MFSVSLAVRAKGDDPDDGSAMPKTSYNIVFAIMLRR